MPSARRPASSAFICRKSNEPLVQRDRAVADADVRLADANAVPAASAGILDSGIVDHRAQARAAVPDAPFIGNADQLGMAAGDPGVLQLQMIVGGPTDREGRRFDDGRAAAARPSAT